MPTTRTTSRFLLLIAFLAFASIAFPDVVLGVAWPSIRDTFDRPLADMGFLLFATGAGYFSSGIFASKALDLLGVGRLLAVSTAAVSIGLFGYAISPGFWFLILVAALIGFGSGAVDAGLNFYASGNFSVTVMNWLHAFIGIGAMGGPFVMAGVLAAGRSWRVGYTIVAVVILVMACIFAITAGRWNHGNHHDENVKPERARISTALRHPLVWLQITIFFLMTGIEASVGNWTFTLLFEKYGLQQGVAGLWAGLFWGVIAAGRLVLPPLARQLPPARLIQIGTVGLLVGGLMMTRDQVWLFQAGILVLGLAMAPLYPTLMSLTPMRLGSTITVHAIGFQVSAAVLGGATIPTLAGILAGRTGLGAIPWTIVFVSILAIAVESLLRTRTADRGTAPEPE